MEDSPFLVGKRWNITILSGKTHHFIVGKLWKIHHFEWENYGRSPFLMGKLWKIHHAELDLKFYMQVLLEKVNHSDPCSCLLFGI